jgi:NADH dehydrogenase
MKVLVTGGTGVVGQAAVGALVKRGHQVRLLSRHAERDVEEWPSGVEAHEGSVSDAPSVRGSATGCDVVLHLVAIVKEAPPDATFERVNVEGTRVMVEETARAGVPRFIYVSSLGAAQGASAYHKSKFAGEEIARAFSGGWLVLRPGNVYGPGDEIISLLLKLMRTLPVVPVIDGGEHEFQPIWAEDLGEALALACERADLDRQTLELTGPDRTSMRDLIARFETIIGKSRLRVPLPGRLASLGASVGEKLGLNMPITSGQITMLEERSVIDDPARNALVSVFHLTPTGLDEGLAKLADSLPEQLPDDGVGGFEHKHFSADIEGSTLTPEALFAHLRENFSTVTPFFLGVGTEPGTTAVPELGATLTMSLPLRGTIQVRVEELTPTRMTLVTLEGHPLAGAVRFQARPRRGGVRFEIDLYDRASNFVDWIAMNTVGDTLQDRTWTSIVERMVEVSGGTAPAGVRHEDTALPDEDAEAVGAWLKRLVAERRRSGHEVTEQTRAEPG